MSGGDPSEAFRWFDALCDLPVADRDQALAHIADLALRERVARMLAADAQNRTELPELGELAATAVEVRATPTRIGRYTIVRRLGEGGMGIVWEARQEDPRRRVAVKTLRPIWLLRGAGDRLRKEAQALAELHHPGIPQVYEVADHEGEPFLAMELVDGVTLDRFVEHLPLRDRVALLREVALAVAHAHARGVVHRDLKPQNLLVTPEGVPKVLDFGIAALGDSEGDRAGTVPYASPEQQRGDPVDGRADVYALGVLGREILLDPDADLAAVLDLAAAPEREDRYSDMGSFAADLEAWLVLRPVRARSAPWGHRIRLWTRRNRRPILLAAGVALASVALLGAGNLVRAWTLEQAREANEQAAFRRLADIEARTTSLRAEGREADADLLIRAFADLPDNQGTEALSLVWIEEARRLERNGERGRALDAWGRAYGSATTSERALEALRGAALALDAGLQWEALDAVLVRLQAYGDAPSPDVRLRAAAGRRDLARAADISPTDPRAPVLRALARGRPEGIRGTLTVMDVDGDGQPEVLRLDGRDIAIHDAGPGTPERARWSFPFVPERPRVLGPSAVVIGGKDADGRGVLAAYPTTTLRAPGPALGPHRLPPPMSATYADLDGDGQREIYAGTGPYDRRLVQLYPSFSPVHAGTDFAESDVGGLVGHDLDGDGSDELIVALGPWRAWDVRAITKTSSTTGLLGRIQTGAAVDLAPVVVGDETWFVAAISDTMPSRTYFPSGPPAPGLALLAWRDGGFVEVARLPAGRQEGIDNLATVHVGDLDGDGLQDLACSLRTQQSVLIARQLPGKTFVTSTLGGLQAQGVLQADDDPAYELLVNLTEDKSTWILGVDAQDLPPRQGARGTLEPPISRDPAWTAALDLYDMGLLAPAATSLEAAASRGDDAARRAAARLRRELSDDLGVLQLLDPLTRRPDVNIDDLREALLAARRLRSSDDAARIAAALAEHPSLPAAERADAQAMAVAYRRSAAAVDAPVPLGPAWIATTYLEDPLAVRWRAAGPELVVRVSGGPDAPPAWAVDLRPTEGPFALDVALELREAELGSGVALWLEGEHGRGLRLDARGGDGAGVWRVMALEGDTSTFLTEGLVDATARPGVAMRLRIEVNPTLRQGTYTVRVGARVVREVFLDLPTPTPRRLLIRPAGDRQYPLALAEIAIREIRLAGVEALPSPTGGSVALAVAGAADHVGGPPDLRRAVARVESRHPEAARDLAGLPPLARSRLLRHVPEAGRLLPPSAFAREISAAWLTTMGHHPRHAEGCRALHGGPIDPRDPGAGEALLWRARCAWLEGRPDPAYADLQAAAAAGGPSAEIGLELARQAATWGRVDEARALIRGALSASPIPEILASRIAADPDLRYICPDGCR